MKKFKTKRNNNISKLIFLFFIVLFIIFIYLSFQKLNHSYYNIVNYLLKDISKEKRNIRVLKNFNYLLSNYNFDTQKTIVKNKMIYLYNISDTELYQDNTSVLDTSKYFQNNLNKLGIKSIIKDKNTSDFSGSKENISYYIEFHRNTMSDPKITINNKDYAKISFLLDKHNPNYLENNKVLENMNNYLNKNYPGLSNGIKEINNDEVSQENLNIILIEVGCIDNNKEEVNNSTEILALMFYNFLGDKK